MSEVVLSYPGAVEGLVKSFSSKPMPVIYKGKKSSSLGDFLAYAYKPLNSGSARLARVLAYIFVPLILLNVIGSVTEPEVSEDAPSTVAEPAPKPATPKADLTAAELDEFDLVVLELDPQQLLVTKMTQWEDSEVVNVTVGNGFIASNQIQQGEIAIAMRDGLAKICQCGPALRFSTEGGQLLVEIGRGQPDYK